MCIYKRLFEKFVCLLTRSLALSSFDQCLLLLSEKVYFLTGSGDEKHQDVRGMSFSASVDFAVSAKLDGIVTSSIPLKGNLGQVEEAVKRGIKVMTYGSLKYSIYLFICLYITVIIIVVVFSVFLFSL